MRKVIEERGMKRVFFFLKMRMYYKAQGRKCQKGVYMHETLSFDCLPKSQWLAEDGFLPKKKNLKNVLSQSFFPTYMTRGNIDLISFYHRSWSQRLSIAPKKASSFRLWNKWKSTGWWNKDEPRLWLDARLPQGPDLRSLHPHLLRRDTGATARNQIIW